MPPTTQADRIPDLTGQLIDNDQLVLVSFIGCGAYGKVYQALDISTRNTDNPIYYAVKCILKPLPGSRPSFCLARELSIHEVVHDHPNIVTMHRVINDSFYVYVILDLAEADLFTITVERRILKGNYKLIKEVFINIVDAVQHSHDLGIAHRDIKPENILCDENGRNARLADFGLATSKKLDDAACGSSFYMSPECLGEFRFGTYSTKHNDIWSLGILLVNLITLHNPWHSARSSDECFAEYLKNPDWLQEALPLSPGVCEIIKSLLHINPLCRMPLWKLRMEVLALDTFYRAEPYKTVRSRRSSLSFARWHAVAAMFHPKDRESEENPHAAIASEVEGYHNADKVAHSNRSNQIGHPVFAPLISLSSNSIHSEIGSGSESPPFSEDESSASELSC